jgi:hypothetical protein
MKASATSPPETAPRNSVERTPVSKIVDERAAWSVACSVVTARSSDGASSPASDTGAAPAVAPRSNAWSSISVRL